MVDDVAWGVGWGEAGNVSAGSPINHSSRPPPQSTSTQGKSRSRSRARPYPEHCHGAILYGSDCSVFSSSVSRSRSRPARRGSSERVGIDSNIQSPSLKTTFSPSTEDSLLSSDPSSSPISTSLSPPFLPTRGRSSAQGTDFFELRAMSRSASQSDSRSRSTPESPATPSDVGPDASPAFNDIHFGRGLTGSYMPPVPEKEEVYRGRRREALRRDPTTDKV